ncbi:pro-neuregulin-3, membrane-bound isoform [Neoarius graeffei]|uniref:pro-neuregulin-3, membrane-bound isoform n=1 Tax=Neoarius graeffei TaxID=443677 RepID=UPI00298CFE9A|nr:pro-neuregulin-3, membrane-bound isoform [Neoarius graeffei]
MSETSGAVTTSGVVILEEPEVGGASGGRQGGERAGAFRCAFWPRQQTWLCVVPLLIGFVGLGLSLMLLKWIVVGSVQDYVPTDLVNAKGIGQDPIFLSKPSALPKGPDSITSSTTTTTTISSTISTITTLVRGKTRTAAPPNANPRDGGSSGSQVTQKTTTAASASPDQTSTSSPSSSKPTVLNDSTREHSTTERPVNTPARTHVSRKTPAPTLPPLKSEHFKPCQEKDLAYCLNDGECFVIETLSGPHKHCRCKEGFQGIRCDQFLPKTDSILSDPTDHLGIEFMESEEVYKRQVLSITCITMGISFLGTLCMALYCRNKRRREKLQAHLKESRGLKNYSVSQPCKAHPGLQLHNYCKSTQSPLHGGTVHQSGFSQTSAMTASYTRGLTTTRHHRSSSVSCNADQKNRSALRLSARRTPPITGGRLNPIANSKDSGPAYQHLQEAEGSERDIEPARVNCTLHRNTFQSMQASQPSEPWVPSRNPCSSSPGKRSFAPYRIPIIPSVHSHQDETLCMQTTSADGMNQSLPYQGGTGGRADNPLATPLCDRVGEKWKEGTHVPEEAQEKLRANTNMKQDDTVFPNPHMVKETVCVLLANGTGHGGTAPSGPTETQLVNPRDMHKDSTQPRQ